MTTTPDKITVTNEILADTLHELNPSRSREEWLDHVRKNGHNPDAFWGTNGEGKAEYDAFVRTYDKDTHEKVRKARRRH